MNNTNRRPRVENQAHQQEFPKTLYFGNDAQELPPPFFLHDNPMSSSSVLNHENDDTNNIDSTSFSLPSLPYTSRRDLPKSAIHWGQRKLFLSELQLLTQILPDPLEPHWIIYVGSAPGQHLIFLDKLFGEGTHEWELVDPGKFDRSLHELVASCHEKKNDEDDDASRATNKSRFTLRSEFFDNSTAYDLMKRRLEKAKCPALSRVYEEIIAASSDQNNNNENDHCSPKNVAHCDSNHKTAGDQVNQARTEEIPIRNVASVTLPAGLGLLFRAAAKSVKTLFVSDVRSGHEDSSSFEEHVFENSMAQETWTDILQPTFAMLKFRLPYSFVREPADPKNPANGKWISKPCQFGDETLHLVGRIMLPLFARLTSTEARLIVSEGAGRKMYNHKQYEDHFFFFNSIFRECVHFALPESMKLTESANNNNNHIAALCELDHRFDGAAEAWVLDEYLKKVAPRINQNNSNELSIAKLSCMISRELHGTIGGAAKIIDDRLIELAEKTKNAGQIERAKNAVDRAQQFRNMAVWRHATMVMKSEENNNMKESGVWKMLFERN